MSYILLLTVILSFPATAGGQPSLPPGEQRVSDSGPEPGELVVLVHGMGRTSMSMLPLARALEKEGYEVLTWGYSSLCCSIPELGERLRRDVKQRQKSSAHRVHFVGHSLGNIIVRWALTSSDAPVGVGHVVMLAPPNQGSHAADRHTRSVGWLLRPIGELRTDSASTVRLLPPLANLSIGVIAGQHDGKVSLHETHLPEESAHVVVPATHSFLMLRGDVQRLVIGFLRSASFPAVEGVLPAHH